MVQIHSFLIMDELIFTIALCLVANCFGTIINFLYKTYRKLVIFEFGDYLHELRQKCYK